MGKFNTPQKSAVQKPDTVNMEGNPSFSRDIKNEIVSVVLNTLLNGDSFYEKEEDRLKRIESFLENYEIQEFIAKTMVYTRTVGNLRSISHFLGVLLSEKAKGTSYLRTALRKSFIRPDDLTEVLSLWNTRNPSKMVPNAVRRAMKDSLEGFSKYQLKKYAQPRSKVKLKDVVKLSHPKGDFKDLIEDTLPNVSTAQTVNAGSTGASRAQNYKSMLLKNELPYMAALKNIKNILESGADTETIDLLCALFRNKRMVHSSRVLPFRYVQAYNAITNLNIDAFLLLKVIKAVEDGFTLSAKNISIVSEDEKVAILLDESGSMGNEDKSPFNLGKVLMASMLTGINKDNAVGYLWADTARKIEINTSPFTFIKNAQASGGGTDVYAPISDLIMTKTKVDKIIILTDMQIYDIDFAKNRKFKDSVREYLKINHNVKILFWNLEGYPGGTPMKLDNNILEISGFSERMIDIAAKILETSDVNYLVKEIEAIEL